MELYKWTGSRGKDRIGQWTCIKKGLLHGYTGGKGGGEGRTVRMSIIMMKTGLTAKLSVF